MKDAVVRFTKLFPVLLLLVSIFHPVTTVANAQDASWPRTFKHAAGEITLKQKPTRIVSTTPSVTGILLAMGAPILATAATTPSPLTDDKGFFKQWATVADERHVATLYPNLEFDLEAIIGFEPDLLIVSATGGDSAVQHYAELQAQGIPTLVVNYANQSWQETARIIGNVIGMEAEVKATASQFNSKIAEIAATIEAPTGSVSIVGYNIGGTYSISSASSAQAKLLEALGFKVSGLPVSIVKDKGRNSDFDFISHENLPAAIAGEHIFLLRGSDQDVQALLSDPVLANLRAIKSRQVYPLGNTSFRIDYYSGIAMAQTVRSYFQK